MLEWVKIHIPGWQPSPPWTLYAVPRGAALTPHYKITVNTSSLCVSLPNQRTNSTGNLHGRNTMRLAFKEKSSRQHSFQMEHTWLARLPFTDYTWPAVEHAGWLHTCVDERRFFPSVPQQTCSVGALEVSPLEAVTHRHRVFSKHTCHTGARRETIHWSAPAEDIKDREPGLLSPLFVCITTSIVRYKSLNRGSF